MAKLLACALNADGGPSVNFDPEAPAARAIFVTPIHAARI